MSTIRIVAISDTHGLHHQITVPDGDLLIHAGDCLARGTLPDLEDFNDWLGTLPHPHKVVIAGNHDWCFERKPAKAVPLLSNAVYLQDQAHEVHGLRIWGSPWQPRFYDWAFNLDRGAPLRAKWNLIPPDTAILVTHGPPWGHGDLNSAGERVGCRDLRAAVERIVPRFHLFGHIHEGYGITRQGTTTLVNASICDVDYHPINAPLVFDYDPRDGALLGPALP